GGAGMRASQVRASQRRVRRKDACAAKMRAPQKPFDLLPKGGGREWKNEKCVSAECSKRQAPRRSASQVPEHSPPVHEPDPAVPESRPEPVALLLPALTVTVT